MRLIADLNWVGGLGSDLFCALGGEGIYIQSGEFSIPVFGHCGGGNHGGIIEAEFDRGAINSDPMLAGGRWHPLPKKGVGGNSTGKQDGGNVVVLAPSYGLIDQGFNDGCLDGGSEVVDMRADIVFILIGKVGLDGGLESAEAEIVVILAIQSTGQSEE